MKKLKYLLLCCIMSVSVLALAACGTNNTKNDKNNASSNTESDTNNAMAILGTVQKISATIWKTRQTM